MTPEIVNHLQNWCNHQFPVIANEVFESMKNHLNSLDEISLEQALLQGWIWVFNSMP